MEETNPQPNVQTPPPTPPNATGPQKNTLMAVLSYIGILVIVPLLTAKDDPFVKFHIKQGLVLLICFVIGGFVFWVPFVGWILWLGCFIMMILGITNASSGKEQELPLIGSFAHNFHF
jgi:uncharacterized membrane protein